MESVKLTIQGIDAEVRELVLDQVLDLVELLGDSGVQYTAHTSPIKFVKALRKKGVLKPALEIILIGDRVNAIEPAKITAGELGSLLGAFFTTNGAALGGLASSLRDMARSVKLALTTPSGHS